MISNAWTIGIPAGHHGRKLTAEYRDIFVGDLASAPEHGALGLDARSGDSLPAQIGAQRRFIRGQRLTPYLMAALVLAFPVELGVFLPAVADTAINQSLGKPNR